MNLPDCLVCSGYMSPEYTMGHFSEKSDVYSFGVILLEIVSGKRNSNFHRDEQCLTLMGYVSDQNLQDITLIMFEPFFHNRLNNILVTS